MKRKNGTEKKKYNNNTDVKKKKQRYGNKEGNTQFAKEEIKRERKKSRITTATYREQDINKMNGNAHLCF